jgi:acyl-coenzyme A synthetase/AMP-(fatty) acid ligase
VDENGEPCPTRTEGELRIKLRPFDCQGYLDDEAATRKFFRDGYFYPGDLAVRREDGRIRVLGRTEDVINVKGFKAPVAPVEDYLQRKLEAETVCVFSEMDDEGESRVVVVVESGREFSDAELAAAIDGRLGFEDARFVVLEKFPRAEAGMRKVNRRELRKLVI